MAKGNWTNHPNKKYAQIKDVARIEQKLDNHLNNDWPHHVKKVDDLIKSVCDMNRKQWIQTGILIVGVPLIIMLVQMVIQGFIKG